MYLLLYPIFVHSTHKQPWNHSPKPLKNFRPAGLAAAGRELELWPQSTQLVGGFHFNPFEKYAKVKLDHFPKG